MDVAPHDAPSPLRTAPEWEASLPDFGPDWQAAREAGIDMWLLAESLRLSPWERLLENQSALTLVRMLEQAPWSAHG
jgi:hypothetical protein